MTLNIDAQILLRESCHLKSTELFPKVNMAEKGS